jgi:hypothetical protein
MFTSRVPLVEFYTNLLPAARSVGYKLVLTALARQADAPDFYEDVKRYWSSLHDATGPDILFVFAGANAAKELNNHGLRDQHEPVAFCADNMAFEGINEKKWKMAWSGRFRAPAMPWSNDLPAFRRGRPVLSVDDDFATDHTLEIYDLSRSLGVREALLPCLVFTLLGPVRDRGPQRLTVPFSEFERSTIYLYLKKIAEELQDSFRRIDEVRREIATAEDAAKRNDKPMRNIRSLRSSIRYAARSLDSAEARDAVAEILRLSGNAGRAPDDRSRCFALFQFVRKDHPDQDGIVSDLQRMIDLSFLERVQNRSFDEHDCFAGVDELRREISNLQQSEIEMWSSLEQLLSASTTRSNHVLPNEKWDFFIAYSSADRSIAERVFSEISSIGRCFLDCRCLRPGDRWTERIHKAQTDSKSTVLLLTENTPKSWFTESEYLYAIELVRKGKHVLVPVLYGQGAIRPYGLEQIHSATIDGWQDIDKLPDLVRHIVEGPPA